MARPRRGPALVAMRATRRIIASATPPRGQPEHKCVTLAPAHAVALRLAQV